MLVKSLIDATVISTKNSTGSQGVPSEMIRTYFGWTFGVSSNNWRRDPTHF